MECLLCILDGEHCLRTCQCDGMWQACQQLGFLVSLNAKVQFTEDTITVFMRNGRPRRVNSVFNHEYC
jgi:hypothetical protein